MTGVTRAGPDWERIELDYRAGVKTLRQIAAEHGITHGAVNKRAKSRGWERDLSAKIHQKADALVSRSAVSAQVSAETRLAERQVVEANAEAEAAVRLTHRTDIRRRRALCSALTEELELQTSERLAFQQIRDLVDAIDGEALDEKTIEKARVILDKALSLPSRADTFKKLTDALKTLIDLERRVWGLDADKGGATYEDFLAELHGEGGSP